MSPLERRYRRMLRLLPAEHRRARGEELLGLLLDLDGERDRPSPRQAIGLLGLALRLRLLPAGSLLLAAWLVADSTSAATSIHQLTTGAVDVTVDGSFPLHNPAAILLISALPQLGTAVAWILGARRTALAMFAASMATQILPSGPAGLALGDLMTLAVLTPAVAWRWPAPRPRIALLAATALAIPLWILVAIHGRHGISYDAGNPGLTLAPALAAAALAAAAAGLLTRHRRRPAVITGMAIGALGGAILTVVVPRLLYSSTDGWLLCATALIALVGAAAGPPAGRHAGGVNPPEPHPTVTT